MTQAKGRRLLIAGGLVVTLAVLFPWAGGAVGARLLAREAKARAGLAVTVEGARAGLGGLRFREVELHVPGGSPTRPLARIGALFVPWGAAVGRGRIEVDGLRLLVDDAAVNALRAVRARAGGGAGASSGDVRARPSIVVRDGALLAESHGHRVAIERFAVTLEPDRALSLKAERVGGRLRVRGRDDDPQFAVDALHVDVPLRGVRPAAAPTVHVRGGALAVLPTLPLTGIVGTVAPSREAAQAIAIDLRGSWAGARERLWDAVGSVRVGKGLADSEGKIALRAERFSLDRIADVVPTTILAPSNTFVDANLDLALAEGILRIGGSFEVDGLSFHHPKLAAEPVLELALSARLEATVDAAKRRLEIARLEGRVRDLVVSLTGALELDPTPFRFGDGSELGFSPKIELALKVPKLPCKRVLASIPGPIVPKLQGFELGGAFEADVRTRIDFTNLEALELAGKVGIDGCVVTKAPASVSSLASDESIAQIVEVPAGPEGEPGETETLVFVVGPDDPDFVPFDQISRHLVNAILTTEDSGFFKHRGFVTSEFRTALKRNLARGGFRLGASSITMQTVKNLLLSQEKTLSRKLQELFLVWYIEQKVPKERILELYFNAIEYGPRLYGIGRASKHYFGKPAAELTPIEAAWFSSILPSPKRRYEHYCRGQLSPAWDKYLRRIMARMHERGRITDEDYLEAATAPFVFDVSARGMNEKACLEWLKRITTARPEPEVPPELP